MTRGGSSLYLVSYSIVRPFFRHKPLFPEIQEKVSYVQSMSVIRCVVRLILIVLQWVHCNAVRKALFVSSWTSVTFFFGFQHRRSAYYTKTFLYLTSRR